MASFQLLLLLFLSSCSAVLADIVSSYCNENSTIKSAVMSENIDVLLPEVANKTALDHFGFASYGQGKDKVYGLGQCREDVNTSVCSTCINDAASQIRSGCGVNSTDIRMWFDDCFLRYDNKNFFGKVDPSAFVWFFNVDKPKDLDLFKRKLRVLVSNITAEAVVPGHKGFGKGEIKVSDSVSIYGLAQCTNDLTPSSCKRCLNIAVGNFPNFCNKENTVGCRVLYSSCIVRYEIFSF